MSECDSDICDWNNQSYTDNDNDNNYDNDSDKDSDNDSDNDKDTYLNIEDTDPIFSTAMFKKTFSSSNKVEYNQLEDLLSNYNNINKIINKDIILPICYLNMEDTILFDSIKKYTNVLCLGKK
jgi:hypothetical protein